MRCSAAALALLAFAAPLAAQSGDVDAYVRDFIARHRIPSAAIVVVKDGRVLVRSGQIVIPRHVAAPLRKPSPPSDVR